jgi:hypothetical protein
MARRLVDKNGMLSWNQQKVFITRSLAGWELGLQRTEKAQLEVWFGRLLLGYLDSVDLSLLRAELGALPQTPVRGNSKSWRLF